MNPDATLSYLLDTNVVIYVMKRRPVELLATFNRHQGRMAISTITLAELMHGVEKSLDPHKNLHVLQDFTSRLETLPYDETAAAVYGRIRTELERTGIPIGVNDLHIAAHARSRGLTLVTNNEREFSSVAGLQVTNWSHEGTQN